jgi:hypothetical protein
MEKVWQFPDDPVQCQQLAWATLLLPDSAADPEKMLRLAQAARKADPTPPWNTYTLALTHCRLGQHDRAAALLRDYLKTHEQQRYGQQDWVALELLTALALARDGRPAEARPHYEAACQRADAVLLQNGQRMYVVPGHAWAMVAALRREAEGLLNRTPPGGKE